MSQAQTPHQKASRTPARERILAAASDLFYREGVQNVGIDRIIAQSGVAKMSLYNHFKSKDALIAAWLEQQHDRWQSWFTTRVEESAADPKGRILAIFDVLGEWFQQSSFRGCAFINSTVELVKPSHPGYQVAVAHQQSTLDYLLDLTTKLKLSHPEAVALQLLLLVQGATVVAMTQENSEAAFYAKQAAQALLSQHQA